MRGPSASTAPTGAATPRSRRGKASHGKRSDASSGPINRPCQSPGCPNWGCYGMADRFWCADHVPDEFWTFKRQAEAARTTTDDKPAATGEATKKNPMEGPVFKNGQGVLL